MPESKGREKPAFTPPPRAAQKLDLPNPRWYAPLAVALLLIGLTWVVVYYLSGVHQYPWPALDRWNLLIGFGLGLGGFIMLTRWR